MRRGYLYGVAGIVLAIVLSVVALPTLRNYFIRASVPETSQQKLWESTASSNQLTLAMRLDTNKYDIRQQMNVTLRLTNRGDSKITLVFTTSQSFDFKVTDESGREMYKWSSERFFLQVVTKTTLEPREKLERTLAWVIDLLPGSYRVIGMTAKFTVDESLLPITLETPGIVVHVNS